MNEWTPRQFGSVLDDFKQTCSPLAWKSLLLSWALVKSLGKMCGSDHAKKLVNGEGIWELKGRDGNVQARPLFYFADARHEVVFVHAFIKQGDHQYRRAIALAQSRRRLIEGKERSSHVIAALGPRIH